MYMRRVSYAFFMSTEDKKTFLEQLGGCSITGTVEEILHTCEVIKTAKESLTEEAFRELREEWVHSEKVWSKLLQVGMDDRLAQYKDLLPAKYTTIHQVHCLTDEELSAAINEGVLTPEVSQGNLNRWLKDWRFRGTAQEVPEDFSELVSILAPQSVPDETLERFKSDLEKVVGIYGFKTQYEGEQTIVSLRQQRSQDKAQELVALLLKDLKPTWEASEHQYRSMFSLGSLEDLVQGSMSSFTGFLNKFRGGREEFWTFHASDYIHKIALEYLKTGSRGQRFNYRRRLKEISEKHQHLAEKVNQVLEEWMNY